VAFEVAIYTDVVASEAVDGVDGFNFQAVSSGLSGTDQQRIRESLLHRLVPSWSISHDELSHPPTCAYIVQDGRAYLARGKSTGTTNSGRPGNQLTQIIVTSDPDDFVPYRPAQLYGALEWTLAKAPNTSVDPWVAPLEIRPEFEVSALKEYVEDDEWAALILPQYLTMLDEVLAAEPKKLVLVHADLDVVMRWIALGTLFVDTETARAVKFRALVDDPWRANAEIVGVSPDFGIGDLGAANVLDLAHRSMPTIIASDVARVRAAWFLEHGADDALNAIEIARRWNPALGPVLANEAARVVGLPDDSNDGRAEWVTSMTTIEYLARAGLRDDLALYADELCEATLGYGPTSEEEFQLAGRSIRRAHDLGVDDVASGILVPTLKALAAIPAASSGFAQQLSGADLPIIWESDHAQETAGAFLGKVLAGAPESALPDVFAAARIIGSPVPEASLRPAVANLAALWLRDPALGHGKWQRWLAGRSVVSATGQYALNAFNVGDYQAFVDLLRGDWDFLAAIVDEPALAGWLKAGQLGRIPLDEREDHVALATTIPSNAWRIVLAGSTLPTHARLWATWITYHGLPDDLAAAIRTSLDSTRGADPADGKARTAGDWNSFMRSLSTARDPELARLSSDYARARSALKRARDDVRARSGARLDGCLPYVSALAPFFLTDIGLLLLTSTNEDEVEKLLEASSPWGPEAVRTSILRLAQSGDGLSAIDFAFSARSHPSEDLAVAADAALAQIVDSQPDLAELAQTDPRLRDDMEKYLRQHARSRGTKRKLGGPFGRGKEN